MDRYRLDDPDLARRRAETLIGDLRGCPIPELARLGRTLHAWRTELRALHPSRREQRADREPQPEDQKHQRIAHGYRNVTHYRLRLLLNHGRIRDDHAATRIRTRRPRLAA